MTEPEMDALAGRLFASPSGKAWLAAHETTHPVIVKEIRERIVRMRARWGDKGTRP